MTVPTCLCLIATAFAFFEGGTGVFADEDVTVIPAPATATPSQKTIAEDGTPVVHKSLHKKKHLKVAKVAPMPAPASVNLAPTVAVGPAEYPAPVVVTVITQPHPVAPVAITISPVTSSAPLVAAAPAHPASLVPTVETGLPIARYPGMGTAITGVSTYVPLPATLPTRSVTGSTTHVPYYASIFPTSVIPLTSSAAGSYSSPIRTSSSASDFIFTNFTRKSRINYLWKREIITTKFWIGEGGSSVSSTDNIGSAWDEHWRSTNHGNDDPDDRNGFASADHASTVNPFYVALPFNDLAFPDKASEWVPRSWHRSNEDGKQVSACKDRWIWIKNSNGRSCFAQWEDVGPLRYDHAEYVFGDERPIGMGDDHAGLDVSPAVWQYLGLDEDKRAVTSWRFVDDEDVPPGQWLKYDEQAVIFTAMHQLRNSSPSNDLPIQRATEPIDDQSIDANKKKVDASKG